MRSDRGSLMRTFHHVAVGAALAAVLAATGCGSGSGSETKAPTSPASDAAMVLTLPSSTGTPLLTFTGKLGGPAGSAGPAAAASGGVGGGGPVVALDRAALDSLNRIELTVSDPFQKRQIGYKGVWLADLLRAAGADLSAGNLRITALDDYIVNIPMSDVRAGGVFLAVQNLDGTAIPVSAGGPTRVVFRDGTPAGDNSEQWIWSIATIEVQ
jgi:hypothetical protein